MKAMFWLTFLTIGLAISLEASARAQDLESRFRKDAPAGWKLLKKKHRQTTYNWVDARLSDSKKMERTVSGSCSYRSDNFLVTVNRRDGTTSVFGGNEIYNFSVKRSSVDEPWTLSKFGPREDISFQADDNEHSVMNRVPWTVDQIPCLDLVAASSFVVESIIEKPDGIVEVEFSVDPIRDAQNRPGLTSGKIAFLPGMEWAISSYEVKLTRDNTAEPVIVVASVGYGTSQEDYISLEHVDYEVRWKSKGQLRSNKWQREIDSEYCDDAIDSFKLSAFGLEEPEMFSGKRNSNWLMYTAGFACLILAVLLSSRFFKKQ